MEFKRNRAGTIFFSKEDGTTMYQCQYCETWFEPKAKFKQKYCGESCRVMACRDRNSAGYPGTYKQRSPTSNTDMLIELKELRAGTERGLEMVYDRILNQESGRNKDLISEIRSLQRKVDWLMLIAALAPVVSPAVAAWLRETVSGKKPTNEAILDELTELKSKLDDDTREALRSFLVEKDLMDIADLLS